MPKLATPAAPAAWMTEEAIEDTKRAASSGSSFFQTSKMEPKKPYRMRCVGVGITGWVGWTNAKKPHRLATKPAPEQYHPDIQTADGEPYKHFVATIVYVYETDEFKVLEMTQKMLINPLMKCIQNPEYGQPTDFDITIEKEGSGKEGTKYTLIPSPPKPLSKAIASRFAETDVDMKALFRDGDPLNPGGAKSAADPVDDDEDEEDEEDVDDD